MSTMKKIEVEIERDISNHPANWDHGSDAGMIAENFVFNMHEAYSGEPQDRNGKPVYLVSLDQEGGKRLERIGYIIKDSLTKSLDNVLFPYELTTKAEEEHRKLEEEGRFTPIEPKK